MLRLQVVKNKCAPPYKLAEFDIMFGSGISGLGCLLDAAEGVDVVQRKGSWYSFGEQKLGQGRDKTLAILADNKEMQRSVLFPSAECVIVQSIVVCLSGHQPHALSTVTDYKIASCFCHGNTISVPPDHMSSCLF